MMRITTAAVGSVLVSAIILAIPVTTGRAEAPIQATSAVLARPIARGDILGADDFTRQPVEPAQARYALTARQAVGFEATRDLAAGSILHASDVVSPRLVKRGEPVTIRVRGEGYAIDSQGKALSSGGEGDLVHVVSTATSRTLDAIVDGPGRVRLSAQ